MVKIIFLAIVLSMPVTHAANIMYQSGPKGNPSFITAGLGIPCDKAVDNFEKQAAKILGSIPFVADARVMGKAEWKEESKNDYSTTSVKTLNVGVTPTLTKEFPTIFLPAQMRKTICAPPKENGVSCQSQYWIYFYGFQAALYEKVIEAQTNQDWMKSFNGTMSFAVTGPSSCTFDNRFSISNATYLWVKRKLIKDIDPTLIEGHILDRFNQWAKSILPAMEGK